MGSSGDDASTVGTNRQALRRRRRVPALRLLRFLAGTLVLFPLVVLIFGDHWTLPRSMVPERATLAEPDPSAGAGMATREVRLHFFDDGGDPGRGITLPRGGYLDLELPRPVQAFRIEIQVDFNDVYEVSASADRAEYAPVWRVPRGWGGFYLITRTSEWLETDEPIRFLRVRGVQGNDPHVVTGLRVELEPRHVSQLAVAAALWGLALALWWLSGLPFGTWAHSLLDRWRRADSLLAAILITAVLIRLPPGLGIVAMAIAVIWVLLRLISLWWSASPSSLFVTVAVILLLALTVPRVFEKVLIARIAELHDLTIDHRPLPGPEINSDRIRFEGEAGDIQEEEFVILFAGDSFTYGLELEYEQAYPYAFESLLADLECSQPVRAINAGWTSASPLLTLRLLREIGYKYQPDLVIYNLDMTDFHDDLSYEARLLEGGDLEIDPGEAAVLLFTRAFPRVMQFLPDRQTMREVLRGTEDDSASTNPVPEDRFFVTSRPLEETREAIEQGVMHNLEELRSLVEETLGATMALVIYPRAYQYSLRESPKNWEAAEYEVLGPFVREPFRYFEQVASRLPFPVLNLLPAFESTDEFPLFLENDPHWNADGARFVAARVRDWTLETGLIPCQ